MLRRDYVGDRQVHRDFRRIERFVWRAWETRGTMSFLALGFCGAVCCKLVVELLVVEMPLKSTVRARCEPRAGGGSGRPPMRCTSTQSGSGLGVKGLLGRFGLGM